MAELNSTYPGNDFTRAFDPTLTTPVSTVPADDPSAISAAVISMLPGWDPIRTCVGGTAALRADAQRLIPQEPREDPDSYKRRIFHAVLPPYLGRLASQAAGLILRKGITLIGDSYWEEWATNVCGDGTTLNGFARQMLETALLWGHASAIIDYDATTPATTLAEQRNRNDKPYLIHVHPQSIRGWRTRNNNPQDLPTQVRIREYAIDTTGRFGEEYKEQIRVLEEGRYEIWRRENSTGWTITESGDTGLDRLPLVTVYGDRQGTLLSTPPLLEVAYLNIAYAQRFCDYMHTIHVGSQPLLTMRGFDPDADSPVGISVNTAILLPVDGGAEFVQPTTDAFDSQLKCLEALEDQISRLGINTLTRQNTTNAAAEAKRMDRIDSDSIMALISADLANAMTDMLAIAAQYVGIDPPEVVIEQDYENNLLDGNSITAVLQLFMQNAISQETLLQILKQGDVLPAGLNIEEEVTKTRDLLNEQNALMGLDPLATDAAGIPRSNNPGQGQSPTSQTLPTPMRPGKNPS